MAFGGPTIGEQRDTQRLLSALDRLGKAVEHLAQAIDNRNVLLSRREFEARTADGGEA